MTKQKNEVKEGPPIPGVDEEIPDIVKKVFWDSASSNIKSYLPFEVERGITPDIEYSRKEVSALLKILGDFFVGNRGREHVYLYGPQGSGKTSSVKYYLNGLNKLIQEQKKAGFDIHYVDCKLHQRESMVLLSLLNKFNHKSPNPRSLLFEDLEKLMSSGRNKAKKKIIIFDECDYLKGNNIIHGILRGDKFKNTVILMITKDVSHFNNLPQDVKAFFSFLTYPPYKPDEIYNILYKRAKKGLFNFDEEILKRISKLNHDEFNSDLRVGIKSLPTIFEYDERPDTGDAGYMKHMLKEKQVIDEKMLEYFPKPHLLVLGIIYAISESNKYVLSKIVSKRFCKVTGLTPGRYRQILSELIKNNNVEKTQTVFNKKKETTLQINLQEDTQYKIYIFLKERFGITV